jgi:hypothetical protein
VAAVGRIVVFLGPTLRRAEAQEVLNATYLPPASQGAIVHAVQRYQPSAILLIDGVFQSEPAVRHNEILWALSRGIPVLGSASMGALRAAELWQYGMIGIGTIFRWYRRYQFAPDDAVAVLHTPHEMSCEPMTKARIDLRLTIRMAHRNGRISVEEKRQLEEAATKLHYKHLTIPGIVEFAGAANGRPTQWSTDIAQILEQNFVSQKKIDALMALRRINARPLDAEIRRFPFKWTAAFRRDLSFLEIDATSLRST